MIIPYKTLGISIQSYSTRVLLVHNNNKWLHTQLNKEIYSKEQSYDIIQTNKTLIIIITLQNHNHSFFRFTDHHRQQTIRRIRRKRQKTKVKIIIIFLSLNSRRQNINSSFLYFVVLFV